MRVLILILSCWLFVHAAKAACTRHRIVNCLLNELDKNADGKINATEVNNFILDQPCGRLSSIMRGERLMEYCDMNRDGVLTVADYDHVPSCIQPLGYQRLICSMCDQCDAYKKRK